jgi:asparagine synthase (glutamine-hydrolysing)
MAANCLTSISSEALDTAFGRMRVSNAGARLHRAASVLPHESPGMAYRAMLSHWEFPDRIVPGAIEPQTAFSDTRYEQIAGNDAVALMMLIDSAVYLPDDILVKVDRASMAVSLESRCPILDYRLFELAWRLPMSLKRRDGAGKWILKQLAWRRVPRELLERPKSGFGVPISAWLRGPLREWSEDLLDSARLRREGYLDAREVERAWNAHRTAQSDNSYRLWSVLMFEAWLEKYHGTHLHDEAPPDGRAYGDRQPSRLPA